MTSRVQLALRVVGYYMLLYVFLIDFQNTMCHQPTMWRRGTGGGPIEAHPILAPPFLYLTPTSFIVMWTLLGGGYGILLFLTPYHWVYTISLCVLIVYGIVAHLIAECTWYTNDAYDGDNRDLSGHREHSICLLKSIRGRNAISTHNPYKVGVFGNIILYTVPVMTFLTMFLPFALIVFSMIYPTGSLTRIPTRSLRRSHRS
jgi:hypothetical protein